MFFRTKRSGAYEYLQLVHNERVHGRVRQHLVATLQRLGVLQKTGEIDALVASCARSADGTAVLEAQHRGKTEVAEMVKIGPVLVFEQLGQEPGMREILATLSKDRQFQFPVERAVILTVLHWSFDPGSNRPAEV